MQQARWAVTLLLGPPLTLCLGVCALTGSVVPRGSHCPDGFGHFHMNLLAFIDPNGYSKFVPDIATLNQGFDDEGFTYIGFGMLLLPSISA